jgi:predicted patatin/cPLA2 family phospholipase
MELTTDIVVEEKQKIRIILPGGGVRGCFQLGVLHKFLESKKFMIDKVFGTSIGAILAPFVACESITTIKTYFDNITCITDVIQPHQIFGINMTSKFMLGLFVFLKMGAYKSIKIIDFIKNSLSKQQMMIAQQKCHVVAYDILNHTNTWFSGESLFEGIRCSSALFVAIPPIKYNNTLYTDGGITEQYPLDYILEKHDTDPFDGLYYFIDCSTRKSLPTPKPSNIFVFIWQLLCTPSNRLCEFELDKMKKVFGNKLVIIRPETDILLNALDCDHDRMKQTFDNGYELASHFLQNIHNTDTETPQNYTIQINPITILV